jgi:hypothetical protein
MNRLFSCLPEFANMSAMPKRPKDCAHWTVGFLLMNGSGKTQLAGCQCAAAGLDFNHEPGGDHV